MKAFLARESESTRRKKNDDGTGGGEVRLRPAVAIPTAEMFLEWCGQTPTPTAMIATPSQLRSSSLQNIIKVITPDQVESTMQAYATSWIHRAEIDKIEGTGERSGGVKRTTPASASASGFSCAPLPTPRTPVICSDMAMGKDALVALARNRMLSCIYVAADSIVEQVAILKEKAAETKKKKNDQDDGKRVEEEGDSHTTTTTAHTNDEYANLLFAALWNCIHEMSEPEGGGYNPLSYPMQSASVGTTIVVFIDYARGDDVAELVRTVCSPEFKRQYVPGYKLTLGQYLGVERVQYVIGGTDIDIPLVLAETDPDVFELIIVEDSRKINTMKYMDHVVHKHVPALGEFRLCHPVEFCRVRRAIESMRDSVMGYARFVTHVKKQKELADWLQFSLHASNQLMDLTADDAHRVLFGLDAPKKTSIIVVKNPEFSSDCWDDGDDTVEKCDCGELTSSTITVVNMFKAKNGVDPSARGGKYKVAGSFQNLEKVFPALAVTMLPWSAAMDTAVKVLKDFDVAVDAPRPPSPARKALRK